MAQGHGDGGGVRGGHRVQAKLKNRKVGEMLTERQ